MTGPNDYIGPDSMTRRIIEKSQGFTDVGLYRISESVRAYAYLILSSQACTRSSIVANTASALTAHLAFLNNFEDIINRRVNIQEDIERYQNTLSYASSKVNYSVEENIHMLPSDTNLKIRSGTVGYNNKIIVSDQKFILGKNDKVNAPAMKSHKYSKTNSLEPTTIESHSITSQWLAHAPNISHEKQEPLSSGAQGPPGFQTTTHIGYHGHNEEKITLVLFLTSGFAIWNMFR